MITIPASQIEFSECGNTIWVHGPDGATVLRIKATGKILHHSGCMNVCSHSDMVVKGDIEVCLVSADCPDGYQDSTELLALLSDERE